MDASSYTATELLHNDQAIRIRAARPADTVKVITAFHKLDSDSVYLRFFGPKKEISAADIKRFQEQDFKTRVTLLATTQENGEEIVIASGTYAREGEDSAEIAFVVEEDYHRQGIASLLLKHLGIIASASGIKKFTAEVLAHNAAMLGVFAHTPWPKAQYTSEGVVHLTMNLN